jgi:hypothetical protein
MKCMAAKLMIAGGMLVGTLVPSQAAVLKTMTKSGTRSRFAGRRRRTPGIRP